MRKFRCLGLAYEAVQVGGGQPVALNAADEVAVAAFLGGEIRFDEIPRIIEDVLSRTKTGKMASIQEVLETDLEARRSAQECVERLHRGKPPMPHVTSVSCPGE
jgi:1-deoxy-D-xylulose-5-phosphate reductoisomerase